MQRQWIPENYLPLMAFSRDVLFIVQQGNRNMEEPSDIRLENVTLSALSYNYPLHSPAITSYPL